jgi:hypothetical protein
VTELFRHATDDQIALAFCFAGVFVSGMIMYFSAYVGPGQAREVEAQPETKPQAEPARRREAA